MFRSKKMNLEDIDKKENWKPQEIVKPEDYKEDEKEEQARSPRKVLNFLAGAIFSLFIGVYGGLRSREIFECVVYGIMFFAEAILSETVSKVLPTYNLQQSLHKFALLFTLTGICSIISGVLKRLFGPNY